MLQQPLFVVVGVEGACWWGFKEADTSWHAALTGMYENSELAESTSSWCELQFKLVILRLV